MDVACGEGCYGQNTARFHSRAMWPQDLITSGMATKAKTDTLLTLHFIFFI